MSGLSAAPLQGFVSAALIPRLTPWAFLSRPSGASFDQKLDRSCHDRTCLIRHITWLKGSKTFLAPIDIIRLQTIEDTEGFSSLILRLVDGPPVDDRFAIQTENSVLVCDASGQPDDRLVLSY